jgi:asparagine synthase (glutamine-hydrolysing)
VSSEAKGLIELTKNFNGAELHVEQFPPGCYAVYQMDANHKARLVEEKRYYEIGMRPAFTPWVSYDRLKENVSENIRVLLTAAVEKRLMSDRRIGCLLSGGLDSSLISALLVKLSKANKLPYRVQSFSIGMGDDSPDIRAAREVAEHIGSEHHEIKFTEEDVFEVLDDVIYSLETCDITTIRASLGMYILSRYIKRNTDTTVIFSGEGADEVAQGYIYFRNAPTSADGDKESRKLLSEIHFFDGLRADRTTSAYSLELRVPFLDQQFTHYFFGLPEKMRQPRDGVLEKHLIREAFNDGDLLPRNILWRHKEAFSDGVAHRKRSLFNVIQDWVEARVSDADLANAAVKYPYLTPYTKESYYYREVFERFYPKQAKTLVPHYWMPNWTDVTDPSARFIQHYAAEE